MAYEKIDPNADGLLYVYIILICVSLFITFKMYKKYAARKTTPTKLMLYIFMLLDIAMVVILAGFTQMVITREKRELYMFSLAFGYCMIMITDLAMLRFGEEVFSFEKRFVYIMNVLCVITAILVVLPWNGYGIASEKVEFAWYRPLSSGLMVLTSMIIFLKIAFASYSNSKTIEDKIAKVGFRWIGHALVSMFLFILFMLLDTLYFVIMDTPGYSFFVYIAWVAAGFFFVFAYLGLIMPDWLKKRYVE